MITFCIPSKNNLRYLKTCITSIQKNSHYQNEILVFVDRDDDGTSKWLDEVGIKYVLNKESECKGIGHAYDTLFKLANNELVVAFHADMIMGIDADKNLVKHHKRGTVVCSTRIEPPLHPPGPEKIVRDFGLWPEDIKLDEFDSFVKSCLTANKDKTTGSSFAPWLVDRRDHIGHDPVFLSVYEDADLFRRFVLAGYKMIQSWDSLVYHLTCRGGQFLGAEKMEDFNKKDELWLKNNQLSMLEYIRKWGGYFKEYGPCEPRPNKKYDVGLRASNCDSNVFQFEPFFSNLSLDLNSLNYVRDAQPKSKFDIGSKFVQELSNDIVIETDFSKVGYDKLQYLISNIEDILEDAEPHSSYEILGMVVIVKNKTLKNIKINLNEDFSSNTLSQ
jgi:glycosyltransferase involved in cell wall biosynthesis